MYTDENASQGAIAWSTSVISATSLPLANTFARLGARRNIATAAATDAADRDEGGDLRVGPELVLLADGSVATDGADDSCCGAEFADLRHDVEQCNGNKEHTGAVSAQLGSDDTEQ